MDVPKFPRFNALEEGEKVEEVEEEGRGERDPLGERSTSERT